MKNVLIPTTLKQDTISAVRTAIKQSKDINTTVILMLLVETPETYSASHLLRVMSPQLTQKENQVLETCRDLIAEQNKCKLKIHHQYGISKPLFNQLVAHLNVGLIILTNSFKNENTKINAGFLNIVMHQKCPILQLSANCELEDFNKALYLESTTSRMNVDDLQHYLNEQFSLQIVSQTSDLEERDLESFTPQLSEIISKNGIDLLIETRKSNKKKSKSAKREAINEILGLPVLSVYEETM